MSLVRDLRNSEIKDLERCPQRWHWGWNDQLTPNRMNTKLWMGIGVHEALAQWYLKGLKRGQHPAEFWQAWCAEQGDTSRASAQQAQFEEEGVEWVDIVELGTWMLEGYVLKYGEDERFEFIATEQTFNMMIPTPAAHKARLRKSKIARLVGTWDGVYRDLETGEIWLIEHKTSAVGGVARFIKMLPVDKQTNTYFMSATHLLRKQGILGPKENIAGINFNWLEKHKPTEAADDRIKDEQGRVRNQPIKKHYIEALTDTYTEESLKKASLKDLAEFAAEHSITVYGDISKNQPRDRLDYFKRYPTFRSNGDLRHIYQEIQNTGVQRENYLLGITPLTKNPTMDCSWDCNFFNLCQLHTAGEDWEEYAEQAFNTKEDRYADHNNQKKA